MAGNEFLAKVFGQGSIYQRLQHEDQQFYNRFDVEANFGENGFTNGMNERSELGESNSRRYSLAASSSAGVPSGFIDSEVNLAGAGDRVIDPDKVDDSPVSNSFSKYAEERLSSVPKTNATIPNVYMSQSFPRAAVDDEDDNDDEVPKSLMYEVPVNSAAARFKRDGENWKPSPAEMSFRFSNNSWFGPPGTSYPLPPPPVDLPAPPANIKAPQGINLESSYMPFYADDDHASVHQLHLPPPPSRIDESFHRRNGQHSQEQSIHQQPRLGLIDPRQRALWKWVNVENLDNFLQEVYNYYLGNGVYSIILSRVINLATLAFVVGFSTYLTACIDYSLIRTSTKLEQVQIPQCISKLSGFSTFCLWVLTLIWFLKLVHDLLDIRRLIELRNFYFYLLGITDNEIQTIAWAQVVERLMDLREDNPITSNAIGRQYFGYQSKQRMGEHDIANRIMRRENYFIAMTNKNILNLKTPLPFLRKTQWLTRSLEWNISLCVMDYVFNEQGQVRSLFLNDLHKKELAEGLKRRFIFAGVVNIIFAPFIVVYLFLLYFFRYFDEYHKNPSTIGSRQYSRLAEWKFREYNELYHIFRRRLNLSYYPASRYVEQFPKEKTTQIFRFLAFMAGSFAAVLGIASVIDPDIFLGFEISPDRTVLFYIGIFGTVLAVARGMIQEETLVFDPEANLRYVAEFTHYLPPEWKGKLHTDEVKNEFTNFYSLKIVLLIQEMASIILTPFVLWFSLPKSADSIVEFFRECSLYVDGIGYVCCFAVFDFSKTNNKTNKQRANR
ncbi:autophagy protein Apg9-domain-containing protein [Lipomyces japonicus]|uniref:autophagy protein Apg9-domain-containing protein n=1 Tax=Lipomyces japonicus TaxID=56871 RepID=UPI0034CD4BD6